MARFNIRFNDEDKKIIEDLQSKLGMKKATIVRSGIRLFYDKIIDNNTTQQETEEDNPYAHPSDASLTRDDSTSDASLMRDDSTSDKSLTRDDLTEENNDDPYARFENPRWHTAEKYKKQDKFLGMVRRPPKILPDEEEALINERETDNPTHIYSNNFEYGGVHTYHERTQMVDFLLDNIPWLMDEHETEEDLKEVAYNLSYEDATTMIVLYKKYVWKTDGTISLPEDDRTPVTEIDALFTGVPVYHGEYGKSIAEAYIFPDTIRTEGLVLIGAYDDDFMVNYITTPHDVYQWTDEDEEERE